MSIQTQTPTYIIGGLWAQLVSMLEKFINTFLSRRSDFWKDDESWKALYSEGDEYRLLREKMSALSEEEAEEAFPTPEEINQSLAPALKAAADFLKASLEYEGSLWGAGGFKWKLPYKKIWELVLDIAENAADIQIYESGELIRQSHLTGLPFSKISRKMVDTVRWLATK